MKYLFFFLAVACLPLFLHTKSNAAEVYAEVNNNVIINNNLDCIGKINFVIKNNDPSKIIRGYDLTIPFKNVNVLALRANGQDLAFNIVDLEYDIISIDFDNNFLKFNESIHFELDYSSKECIQQSYQGLWELFIPSQQFEEVVSYQLILELPNQFFDLIFLGDNFKKENSKLIINDTTSHYFAWFDSNIFWKVNFDLDVKSSGAVNFPRILDQYVFLDNANNILDAVVNTEDNLWLEFSENRTYSINLLLRNDGFPIKNVDYNIDVANTELKIDELSEFKDYVLQMLNEYEIKNDRTLIYDEKQIVKDIKSKKINVFEACLYLVDTAQYLGFSGYIEYGYIPSKMLIGVEPSIPYLWCVVHDNFDYIIVDPFLNLQNTSFLEGKNNYMLRIPWGFLGSDYRDSKNNYLGLKNGNLQKIKIDTSIWDSLPRVNYEISVSVPDKIYPGIPFDMSVNIENKTSRFLTLNKIKINKNIIDIEDQVLVPGNIKEISIKNIVVGSWWDRGKKDMIVTTTVDNVVKSNSFVLSLKIPTTIHLIVTFMLVTFIVILLLKTRKYILRYILKIFFIRYTIDK
jgi:hypothetical protein